MAHEPRPWVELKPHKLAAACQRLVDAYAWGEEQGGSVDWEDVDDAYALALEALALEVDE